MKGFLFKFILLAFLGLSNSSYAGDETFNITLRLHAPFSVTEKSGLIFSPMFAGVDKAITIKPSSVNAAVFKASGEKNRNVASSIVEPNINMINGPYAIPVNSFEISGSNAFNDFGRIDDLRVGATAHIKATIPPGNYSGIATFRLIYQ